MTSSPLEARFRVMASATHVILVDPAAGAAQLARERLQELERRWSRFLPDSELSRLNESPGAFLVVSPDTVTLLTTMKEASRVTAGRYDPTMLEPIVAAGYDTSVDGSGRTSRAAGRAAASRTARSRIPGRAHSGRVRSSALRRRTGIAAVHVDAGASVACVPCGAGLDAGGIGKGLAADLVATELLEGGTTGALVCVGGDLAAAGAPPTPEGWLVRIEDPHEPSRELATLCLQAGGVATSSTLSRRWQAEGIVRHHALDPATGEPSATDLAAVTVVARAGWEAEAHATAALLAGSGAVLDYLDTHGLEGIAATLDGRVLATPSLAPVLNTEGSAA